MKRLLSVSIVGLILATIACVQAVNLEQERAALLAADAAWFEAAAAKDLERSLAFLAAGGSMLPPNAPIASSEEELRAFWSEMMSSPDLDLSWKASQAEVAQSGDMGFTRGTYELSGTNPEGNPVKDQGKYVTVWQKQADGEWKVVADIWNSDLPPPAATSQ